MWQNEQKLKTQLPSYIETLKEIEFSRRMHTQ